MNERNGEGEGMNGRKNKRMNGRKKEQMKGRTSKTRRAVAIATVCIPFPVCLSRADFLLNFNGNHGLICERFQVAAR